MQSWSSVRSPLPNTVYAPPPPRRRTAAVAAVLALALLALLLVSSHTPTTIGRASMPQRLVPYLIDRYNYTYPASEAVEVDGTVIRRFATVADMDKRSRDQSNTEGEWLSRLTYGKLVYDSGTKTYRAEIDSDSTTLLTSSLAAKGRGAELSELQFYNGKLLTVDDRTGVVFEISKDRLVPRFILADGNGQVSKGLKAEWMTVKNRNLFVGGIGRDWTTAAGEYINSDPKWVKVVTPGGAVHHVDWSTQYAALQEAAQLPSEGYLWHESAAWSDVHQRWFFLPRRASAEPYDEVKDETRGTNLLITADESFARITVTRLGEHEPLRGFSSFKFVPGTNDSVILALRTMESNNTVASFLVAYEVPSGRVVLPEMKISNEKLEGVEFV